MFQPIYYTCKSFSFCFRNFWAAISFPPQLQVSPRWGLKVTKISSSIILKILSLIYSVRVVSADSFKNPSVPHLTTSQCKHTSRLTGMNNQQRASGNFGKSNCSWSRFCAWTSPDNASIFCVGFLALSSRLWHSDPSSRATQIWRSRGISETKHWRLKIITNRDTRQHVVQLQKRQLVQWSSLVLRHIVSKWINPGGRRHKLKSTAEVFTY